MFLEGIFGILLILTTLLSSLVAGLLFAFAIVIMPGLGNLEDGEFLRSFQVIDRIIQDNQPIFMLVWGGSVLTSIASVALGIGQLDGIGRFLIILAVIIYLFGVQLPTIAVNVPLNNQVQTLDVDAMDAAAHKMARNSFEPRWNRWNVIRTVLSVLVALLLLVILFRL